MDQNQTPFTNPGDTEPVMTEKGNSSGVVVFAVVFILIVAAVAGYFVYQRYTQQMPATDPTGTETGMTEEQAEEKQLVALDEASNWDTIIDQYQNRERGSDINREAWIDLYVANALFWRNTGEDRMAAIDLYRSVGTNSDIARGWRAKAFADLAFALQIAEESLPEGYVEKNVITASFVENMPEAGTYTNRDYIKTLYEISDRERSNAFAKFGILSYYTRMYFETGTIDAEDPVTLLTTILDAAVTQLAVQYDGFSDVRVADMRLTEAFTLSVIDRLGGSVSPDRIEAAYAAAVEAGNVGTSRTAKEQGFINRLMYAIYLSNTYGDERLDDIVAVLRPLTFPGVDYADYPRFSALLKTAADSDEGDFFGDNVRRLVAREGVPPLPHFED